MLFKSKYKIFIIVGEESGENIGYNILSSLKKKINFQLYGVGGRKLKSLGLKSIFNYTELSIMGILEVIPKVPKLIKLIHKTFTNIIEVNPDLIITIDSPDFVFRVLKKAKHKNYKLKTLHIVAPTVWAWKANRAKKIARYVDNLFVLFPFEKKYFVPHGIKTTFIGHPLIEKNFKVKTKNFYPDNMKKIISVYPGSRRGEIDRHLDKILFYISKNDFIKEYKLFIIAVDEHLKLINDIVSNYTENLDILVLKSSKYKNFSLKYSKYAIAVSGTISLELALNKVPLIVVYKLNFFTYFILKQYVKVKYVSLANIILNKQVIPELIQEEFSCKRLNEELGKLLKFKNKVNEQLKMFNILNKQLKCNRNDIAIKEIIRLIKYV